MVKKSVSVIFLCFIAFSSFSQITTSTKKPTTIPTSIYVSLPTSTSLNSSINLNERIKLDSYKFVYLNTNSIEEGYFTIPIQNNNTKISSYVFDTYQEIYNKLNLEKSFFKISKLYQPFQYQNDLQKKRFR
jgi:hypothetical protein